MIDDGARLSVIQTLSWVFRLGCASECNHKHLCLPGAYL